MSIMSSFKRRKKWLVTSPQVQTVFQVRSSVLPLSMPQLEAACEGRCALLPELLWLIDPTPSQSLSLRLSSVALCPCGLKPSRKMMDMDVAQRAHTYFLVLPVYFQETLQNIAKACLSYMVQMFQGRWWKLKYIMKTRY